MGSETNYPPWVKAILEKISITIYRGRTGSVLRKDEPILNLNSKPLSHGGSEYNQTAYIIGFEDEEKIWNKPSDCSDIVVKIYDLKEPGKYRVEIFCSGVNRKVIKFEGKEILNYQGYDEEDIKDIRNWKEIESIRGTVIFDVQIPKQDL
ncbi:MAG: hypothetical protein DRO40_05860 [Thermoprotei archaeon]|nr:MAG: hypothetical protein DRO40_05860 [Thermoprotei archaeon]